MSTGQVASCSVELYPVCTCADSKCLPMGEAVEFLFWP